MDHNTGESYAMFLYKNNMTWSTHHLNSVGFAAPGQNNFHVYNAPHSTKPAAFNLDKLPGNTGVMIIGSFIEF